MEEDNLMSEDDVGFLDPIQIFCVRICLLSRPFNPPRRPRRTPVPTGSKRYRGGKRKRGSWISRDRQWTRQKYVPFISFTRPYLTYSTTQIADAVKRYSYLLGQTELFKHFVGIKVRSLSFESGYFSHFLPQRASDPEYAR